MALFISEVLKCSLALLSFSDTTELCGSCGHLASPTVRDKTLWGRSGRAGSLFPTSSCCFCSPCLTVRGSSGLCVQHVVCWQALVNRWGAWMPLLRGVEEKPTPSEWLCMKPSAYWWKKKPAERTCRVCPCCWSWRLKSSEGQGINHKFKACTPRCTPRLCEELMLISLPLLQTSNTNPCDLLSILIFFFNFKASASELQEHHSSHLEIKSNAQQVFGSRSKKSALWAVLGQSIA